MRLLFDRNWVMAHLGSLALQPIWLDEDFGWDSKSFVEASDHIDSQSTLAIQDFRHTRTTPDVWLKISSRQPSALHVVFDCRNWIG